MSRLRRVLIIVIAAVLVLLLARAGLDVWARARVSAAVGRLEQRYGHLHEGTLVVPSVPPGENRARAFRAAAALVDFGPLADQRGLGLSLARLLQAEHGAPLPADLRAFVDGNDAAIRVAQEARARARSNWEGDYVLNATATGPPWMDVRALSNVIYLTARRDLDDGRVDDAAIAIASGLALSGSVRQEPSLIAQLLRCAFGMQHFEAVQRLVTQSEPSRAALEELARLLAEDRAPSPMDVGLLGELQHFHGAFTRLENGEAPVGALTVLRSWVYSSAWLGRPFVRLVHARYLEKVGHLLDVQTGPRPRPAFTAMPTQSPSFFPSGVVNLALAGLDRTMDRGDLFTTQHGLTELAVALRRFRLDHGRYPDDLSALTPEYLPTLPVDASTGLAPTYAREGTGFRLLAQPMENMSGPIASGFSWAVSK